MIRTKDEGGIKLCNMHFKNLSLHFQWIAQLHTSSTFNYVHDWLCTELGVLIWSINVKPSDLMKVVTLSENFWKNLLLQWLEYSYHKPVDSNEVEEQIIWLNSWIQIDHAVIKPIKNYIDKGLVKIKDMLKESGEGFLSFTELQIKYELEDGAWLWYQQMMNAIPRAWKTLLRIDPEIDVKDGPHLTVDFILTRTKIVSAIYLNILKRSYDDKLYYSYATRWFDNCEVKVEEEEKMLQYSRLFKQIKYVTHVTKLRDFQYRLLLLKTYANDVLKTF